MTPQGLTVTENYLLISAYSKSKKFHSVIWVMDKDSGEFLKTVVLKGTDHVGGMAYDKDNKRLWITAVKRDTSNAMIGCLSLDEIDKYDFDKDSQLAEYDDQYILEGLERTSYLTLHDHVIYAGYFSQEDDGVLCTYPLDADGFPNGSTEVKDKIYQISPAKTASTPNEIQGITFYYDKIILSQSYGSDDAHFMVYTNPGTGNIQDLNNKRKVKVG